MLYFNWDGITEIITTQIALYFFLFVVLGAEKNKLFFLTFPVSVLGITALEILGFKSIWFVIISSLLIIALPLICVKSIRKLDIIFVSLLVGGFSCFVYINVNFFTAYISPNLSKIGPFNIIADIILLTLVIIIGKGKNTKFKARYILSLTKGIKLCFVLFTWLKVFLVMILSKTFLMHMGASFTGFIYLFITLIISVIFAITCNLVHGYLNSKYQNIIDSDIKKSLDYQVEYYRRISKRYDELKKFKHDQRNINIGLTVLLKKGDAEGALKYIQSIENNIGKSEVFYSTGNDIVDALITEKAFEVKDKNIELKFNGVMPYDVLKPTELCVVFGNILDNAIEACLKDNNSHHKLIEMSVKKDNNWLFLKCSNPVFEAVKIVDDTIASTKKVKSSHGFGLNSIKMIVGRYNGQMSLSCDNNIFLIDIGFYLPQISSKKIAEKVLDTST